MRPCVCFVPFADDPKLVRRIGEHRRKHENYSLFFHDTHHRMVTAPETMSAYDLTHYDGVLANGNALRDAYKKSRRAQRAWTWHEAADIRVFKPQARDEFEGDLVWIGTGPTANAPPSCSNS